MNGHNKFIAFIVAGLLIVLLVMMCRDVRPPIVTPTLAISETPSLTPMPPTSTATPTVILVTLTLPAGGTAVAPSLTPTAVSPTSTPTVTPTPTAEPTVTATDEGLLIKPGVTYWHTAKDKYGHFECWQMLKARNGWHERRLPIGEFMRLPKECE